VRAGVIQTTNLDRSTTAQLHQIADISRLNTSANERLDVVVV